MGSVVIGIQCVAANGGRCYARELVEAAEEFTVPLTWLIGVSVRDPMGNANLYRNEYLHRIPSWHEIGLLLDLSNGAETGDRPRGDVVRLGKEVLKQCHVKPTSCWTVQGDLDGATLRSLEDAGMLVLIAPDPIGETAPSGLFRPAYDRPNEPGDARVFRLSKPVVDLATEPDLTALEDLLTTASVTLVSTRDNRDDTKTLRRVLKVCADAGAPVRTLTATIRD